MSGSIPTIPGVSVQQFRLDFPPFDVGNYPDAQVLTLLQLSTGMFDPIRWGAYYNRAVELFAAHNLALAKRAGAGGIPGIASLTSSKSVGKVSVGYDNSLSTIQGAGPYNLTIYGQELYFWMQIFGIGAVQLTPLDTPIITQQGFVGGWPGPLNNP